MNLLGMWDIIIGMLILSSGIFLRDSIIEGKVLTTLQLILYVLVGSLLIMIGLGMLLIKI